MIQTADIQTTIYEANGVPFEMITVEKGRFRIGNDKKTIGKGKARTSRYF